ncbi:TRAP transporter small permease subunit [Rhodobacteraceae bacterium D3-12]|nr:TRAP transporter small permease subunit [Rhodobacteraceae bacterium D3-12]
MPNALIQADRYLKAIDIVLAALAATAIFSMMLITATDVLMRYAFNDPLEWVYDLTVHYLLIAGFFLGLSYTLRLNHHITVDFFARKMRPRAYHAAMAIGCLLTSGVFFLVAWLGAHEAYSSWKSGDVLFGAVIWPIWPSKLIVPLGMAPLALRAMLRMMAHLCAASDLSIADALEINIDAHAIPKE